MRVTHLAAMASLMVTPALADADGAMDFDALFADRAAEVAELMSARGQACWQLDRPDGVTIRADGTDEDRRFSAMDQSSGGAVGCLWPAYHEAARFDATRPAVPRAALREHREAVVDTPGEMTCDITEAPVAAEILVTLTALRFEAVVERMLPTPRSPVTMPFF